MIDDALTLADPYLHISDKISDPETFYLLTDSLLNTIESSTLPVRIFLFYILNILSNLFFLGITTC